MSGLDLTGMAAAVDPDRLASVASTLVTLRGECREHAIRITSDGAVDQHGAARLIDRGEKTLRNWRLPSCALPTWQRIVGRKIGGKVTYLLEEIAAWRVDNVA